MRARELGARVALTALLVAAAAAPRVARAQGIPGELRGTVLTTDAVPVSGARVTLAPAGRADQTVVTGDDGAFQFAAPGAGPAMLRVRRIGFAAESLAVTLPRAEGAGLEVRLAFLPQALAPVVVEGKPTDRRPPPIAEFYRRQSRGMGRFITRAEIERRRPMRTTDLLRTVPGVQVSGGDFSRAGVRFRNSTCPPEIYLDGMAATAGPLDIDAIAPNSLEGIEVHGASTVPVEYTRPFGRSACGTVLLWSRYGEVRPRRTKGKPVTSDDLARAVAELRLYTADQVDSVATPPTDFADRVVLPDTVRVQGVLAVIAEFVVDTAGRVEPTTVNVVASPHPALSDAVRGALPGTAFAPAVRAGRRVRQLVQLSVRFGESQK